MYLPADNLVKLFETQHAISVVVPLCEEGLETVLDRVLPQQHDFHHQLYHLYNVVDTTKYQPDRWKETKRGMNGTTVFRFTCGPNIRATQPLKAGTPYISLNSPFFAAMVLSHPIHLDDDASIVQRGVAANHPAHAAPFLEGPADATHRLRHTSHACVAGAMATATATAMATTFLVGGTGTGSGTVARFHDGDGLAHGGTDEGVACLVQRGLAFGFWQRQVLLLGWSESRSSLEDQGLRIAFYAFMLCRLDSNTNTSNFPDQVGVGMSRCSNPRVES